MSLVLSEPLNIDLEVYRGDSGRFRIEVKTPGGDPVDISAATWDADIRQKANSPDIITNFEIVLIPGVGSDPPFSVEVILSAEKSALLSKSCVYDVEMTLDDNVATLVTGSIIIKQDVSRS